ncbi:mucin-7-like [Ptychodera flava]|uniref:mucin-7-like n=1 Tax=Ptychodera flava TaxID=63121 RepID=UPI00396A1432
MDATIPATKTTILWRLNASVTYPLSPETESIRADVETNPVKLPKPACINSVTNTPINTDLTPAGPPEPPTTAASAATITNSPTESTAASGPTNADPPTKPASTTQPITVDPSTDGECEATQEQAHQPAAPTAHVDPIIANQPTGPSASAQLTVVDPSTDTEATQEPTYASNCLSLQPQQILPSPVNQPSLKRQLASSHRLSTQQHYHGRLSP